MTAINERAAFAAAWWSRHLQTPPAMDNGTNQNALLTFAASRQSPLTPDQISAFGDALYGIIARHLNHPSNRLSLDVDYDADMLLEEAAAAAGISLAYRLPIKTYMHITETSIMTAQGYRAELVTLWKRSEQ